MPLLNFDALPSGTTKGTLLRLMVQLGGIDRGKIGLVRIRGRRAEAEVPDRWAAKLAQALDGADVAQHHIRCWASSSTESTSGDQENHFQRLRRLLEVEAEAEAEAALRSLAKLSPGEAERSGRSLCNLAIRDRSVGLGGRLLTLLGRRRQGDLLPWTRLDVGSPVLISVQGDHGDPGVRGVVSRRTAEDIEVAMSATATLPEDAGRLRLDISGDEISRRRQRQALERAETASGDRLAEIRQVLLGDRQPRFGSGREPVEQDHKITSLNDSQREAVEFALAAEDLAIIHGPPGTGKTTTVAELIRAAVEGGEKVLACAPSNMGVDNLIERLVGLGLRAVRLGHPARVLPQLRERTLDLMVQSHPDMQIVKKLVRDANDLHRKAARYTRAKPAPGAKREMREEARQLRDEARRMERAVVRAVLDEADVLCATLTSLDSEILGQRRFDTAVIDEACQATEPGCWIPLLRSDRLILAGDHCQLPPTVVSREAQGEGFGVSLLERMVDRFGADVTRRLQTQYRMHRDIMRFSSSRFYDDGLIADETVADHRLDQLAEVATGAWTDTPLHFIDTAGADYAEQQETEGSSRFNAKEASLAARVVRWLIEAGVAAKEIALIAPYSAQVRLLREMLAFEFKELEIDSVDGFQGREKEAVVISLVRGNNEGEIGFLGDTRRMNVAMTRARRKLIVIGDSATIGGNPFYAAMLEHFEQLDAYHTVWEYGED